jgi:cell division protein FtsB
MSWRRRTPRDKVERVAHAGEPGRRSWGTTLWVTLVLTVTIGVLAVTVFPVRQYLRQRHDIDTAQHQVDVIQQENERLAGRVQLLNTDAEIERVAREQYHLIKPGEQAYGVLAPSGPASLPNEWPYNLVAAMLGHS